MPATPLISARHRFNGVLIFAAWFLCMHAIPVFSATWFVATNGVDTNTGTNTSPFATIMRTQTAASSGDTVYLRGGTYFLNNSNLTAAQWTVIGTNKSDLAGDCSFTNPIPSGIACRFYRISLP